MNAARLSAARLDAARLDAARLDAARLEFVFEGCFSAQYRTRLQGGEPEPFYRPAREPGGWHVLSYREDFFASALHEVAHWCIAGENRRRLPDFGYWYAPAGRGPAAQRAFEEAECGPQALEWLFARACDSPFRLSADNIDPMTGALPDQGEFARSVVARARRYAEQGLPPRAGQYRRALCREFGTDPAIAPESFALEALL